MYVCLCQGITDRQVRSAVEGGCCSMRDLRARLQVCADCGKCGRAVKALLTEARECAACPAAGPEPCLRRVASELDALEADTAAEAGTAEGAAEVPAAAPAAAAVDRPAAGPSPEPAARKFVRPQPVWGAPRFSGC